MVKMDGSEGGAILIEQAFMIITIKLNETMNENQIWGLHHQQIKGITDAS